MELNSALLTKPAAGEAAPRRATVVQATLRRLLNPVVSLLLRAVVLGAPPRDRRARRDRLTATIPGELKARGSALWAATLPTSSAAVLHLAWVLPLAATDAAAVLGTRLPHRFRARAYLGAAVGDLVVALAGLAAASGSVGVAQYAASYEGAGWPWSRRYVSVAAAPFLGYPALLATSMLDLLHAAACARNIEF